MTDRVTHETEHEITVPAPAATVFDLLADCTRWPRIFPPSIHVEYVDRGDDEERIRIWATANGEVKSWTSRRQLDRAGGRIRFRQEVSQPPVGAMGGEWHVEPLPGGGSRVRLGHDFRAVDDDPAKAEWIRQAVDRNSTAELAALSAAADPSAAQLMLTFDDQVRVPAPTELVYDFISQGAAWPARIPHVARAVLEEPAPGVQLLEMDTLTPDGSSHTTRSIRICLPPDRIVYKQLQPPALMSVHTGQWRFEQNGDGTVVTSTHTVVINPAAVPSVLGPQATVADARDYVHRALSRNSTATIRVAGEFLTGEHAGSRSA